MPFILVQSSHTIAKRIYLTTSMYPINLTDAIEAQAQPVDGLMWNVPIEAVEGVGASIAGGALTEVLLQYDNWSAEAAESTGAELTGGTLTTLLQQYDNYPPEAMESLGATVVGGTFDTLLIQYNNWSAEAAESTGATIVGGTLE